METIIISVLLTLLTLLLLYQIRIDSYTRKRLFDIQIEMAQGQQAMTKELPWGELKKIIDEIIGFTVTNYIITNGLNKMKEDELTLNWTMILNEVCSEVELSLSDEIKRQMLKTISLEYLTKYIKNSVQLVIVYNLQKNKDNTVNNRLERIQNGAGVLKQRQDQTTNKKEG